MNSSADTRRPDQIEEDIERTRAEVSSTIDAIQSKLTPGQMMDQAIQYLRNSGTGEFGSNLGRTVRDNPVPVALIGVGIAWLAMGGGRPQREASAWASVAPVRPRGAAASTWAAGDSGLTDEAWADADDRAADLDPAGRATGAGWSGHDVGDRMRDTVSGATGRMRDAVTDTTGSIRETVGEAAQRARELAHQAGDRLSGLGHDARSRAGALQDRTRMQVDRARERTMQVVEEQPLVLGAVGIAIGAALGAALPSTRREDRLMGGVRDGVVGGAAEVAREQVHGVAESAQRVARTARDEVERAVEGRDPSAASPDPSLPSAPY